MWIIFQYNWYYLKTEQLDSKTEDTQKITEDRTRGQSIPANPKAANSHKISMLSVNA